MSENIVQLQSQLATVTAERDRLAAELKAAREQEPVARIYGYGDARQELEWIKTVPVGKYELFLGPIPAPDSIPIQEAWIAAGGNPGIAATKAELLTALKMLDDACDAADIPAPAPSVPEEWRQFVSETVVALRYAGEYDMAQKARDLLQSAEVKK